MEKLKNGHFNILDMAIVNCLHNSLFYRTERKKRMTIHTSTPVIFRKWKKENNAIIALFPTEPGDSNLYTCMSYMHIGQHGAANLDIIYNTVPAQPEEYQDLLEELINIGYDDLLVYQKHQYWMQVKRTEALNRTDLVNTGS
jgi:hypothetical protein